LLLVDWTLSGKKEGKEGKSPDIQGPRVAVEAEGRGRLKNRRREEGGTKHGKKEGETRLRGGEEGKSKKKSRGKREKKEG